MINKAIGITITTLKIRIKLYRSVLFDKKLKLWK